jgi:signal transduction histidine kinase
MTAKRQPEQGGKSMGALEKQVHQRTAALRRANEKLRKEIAARHRMEREILEISEREQQRIGRDLHDDLGQRLVGISYMSHYLASVLTAKGAPEATQASKITALLNGALGLTRSLSRGLHPVSMKSGGLRAALTGLAERTSEMYLMDCHFTGPSEEPHLGDSAATHLYRIAQEAVTNAVKHGKATVISIELEAEPGCAVLSITDNGTGLPKLSPRRKEWGCAS